ncbi:MAG: LolA family protein [Planctomycetota bacterium]|jgi:hypothetical protein
MRFKASGGAVAAVMIACLNIAAAQEASKQQPDQILMHAKAALAAAGTIKADLLLEAYYPAPYKSEITILASPTGDERAEIRTTVGENSYSSLEVISKGVLWLEEQTPVGPTVSKIDIARVKRTVREEDAEFAALPILGTNLLFDLDNIARLINFDRVVESTAESVTTYVLTGKLAAGLEKGRRALPAGAEKYYGIARVQVDAQTFLPRRVELGEEEGKPLVSIEFLSIEKNVETDEETFVYSPPEDVEVVDRTDWAIAQLLGQ